MRWLILFAGGGLGAMMRFALALWVDERAPSAFPWGTLVVNVAGCFLIGLLATVADEHRILPPAVRLFLVAGLLGGFTTFSTFSLETWRLVEDTLAGTALLYVAASLAGTLVAVVLGVLLGRSLT
jgi:CrcB protein